MSHRQELLTLIEAALNGDATNDQALAFMGKVERGDSEDVQSAAHALIHFLDDHDIREADEIYDRLQRNGLQEWVRILARQE